MADAECGMLDVGCEVGNAVNDWLVDLTKSVATTAAQWAGNAATFWLNVPSPNLTDNDPTATWVQGSLYFYTTVLAVISIMVAGIRIMWTQRMDPGRELAKSLATLILVNGAGLTFIGAAIYAGDAFSKWIIDQATSNFGQDFATRMHLDNTDVNLATAIGMLLIALVATLMSGLQIILMIVRNGFLIVLAGVWPTTAAATNTEFGMAWFKRTTGWLAAYLLYKPVSAIVYATALKGATAPPSGTTDQAVVASLSALTLMVTAVVALPALLRFAAPVMQSVTGGGAGAGAAALGAVPAGAMAVSAMRGSGGGGSSVPSGAASATAASGAGGASGAAGAAGAAGPAGAGAALAASVVSAGVRGASSAVNGAGGGNGGPPPGAAPPSGSGGSPPGGAPSPSNN